MVVPLAMVGNVGASPLCCSGCGWVHDFRHALKHPPRDSRRQFHTLFWSSRRSLLGNPDFYIRFYPLKFLGAVNLPHILACLNPKFPKHEWLAGIFSLFFSFFFFIAIVIRNSASLGRDKRGSIQNIGLALKGNRVISL